jgi:hypothetical protein
MLVGQLRDGGSEDLPPINVSEDLIRFTITVLSSHIFHDPSDEVILERAFDYLVEEVGCQKFVNVGTGKVCCKRLGVH